MRLYDFPDPTTHTAARVPTTTPLQGLFTLNSPLLADQAAALAARLGREAADDSDRVRRAYRLLFARSATDDEVRAGRAFLAQASWQEYAQVLLAGNEFLFVE
ncbi:MAG: DUF1553 domain-containing protein [Gemmataceae bacterium]